MKKFFSSAKVSKKFNSAQPGFTLIELLIVIVIIAALAVSIFVVLNPVKRLQDARNAKRTADTESIRTALHEYIVDKGSLPPGLATGMLETQIGTSNGWGTSNNPSCIITTGGCNVTVPSCVDLSGALTPYLKSMPLDSQIGSAATTGYSVNVDANNIVTVNACGTEGINNALTPTQVLAMLNATKEISYFPANNGWEYMWQNFNAAQIDSDFSKIQSLGFNTVRIMCQAQTGAFDYPLPTANELSQLSQVIALAHTHNLKVHVTLFGLWSQWTDIAGSKQWANAVVAPLAGDSRISMYEIRNELDTTNANALTWAQTMIPYVKSVDGGIPVTVSEYGTTRMQTLVNSLQSTPPDFWDYHLYNHGGTSYSVLSQVKAIVNNTPLFIGETGYTTYPSGSTIFSETPSNAPAAEAQQEYDIRLLEYAVQGSGLPFASPWIYSDFTNTGIPPDAGTASEQYQFGIYRTDGSAKPVVSTLQSIVAANPIDKTFNNSFEQNDGNGLPILWREHQNSSLGFTATFAWDNTVAHSGTASVKISNSTTSPSGTAGLYLNPVQYVIPGQTYTLSAWVKGLNATGSNYIAMSWFDQNGAYISQNTSPNIPTGSTTWQQLTATGVAPANAAAMQLALSSKGNTGSVWYDDVTFIAPN